MINKEEVSFKELIYYFWSNKKIIFSVTFLSGLLAIVISLSIPPTFTSTITLVPIEEEGGAAAGELMDQLGGTSIAGISIPRTSNNKIDVIIAEITSREFAEKYIKEFNLYKDLYPDLWDTKEDKWKDNEEIPSSYFIQKKFRDSYSVIKDPRTSLVYLTVRWGDPKIATEIANGLVESYESYTRIDSINLAERKIGYLEKEIGKTDLVGVKTVLYNLIERELRSKLIANTSESLAFKVIDPAYEPEIRSWPARKFITVLGTFLGFLASTIFILLRYFFTRDN
tara:strand:+ start:24097 stop:24945 length:849 start_codon:yes stop_codon:yes gene_type:complete